jgi:hypothetical protein
LATQNNLNIARVDEEDHKLWARPEFNHLIVFLALLDDCFEND